ncbi:hypothetical protein IWQ49_003933 [Labrenzia sp. EL_126]|nr:hypothetical protein [Labrenzia sp. EL_126]
MTDVRMTITIPADLKKHLKVKAAENDRTLSGEIVRSLKVGSEWTVTEKKSALIK